MNAKEFLKEKGISNSDFMDNGVADLIETLLTEYHTLQLLQTGVSTCFLEDYEDNFFEVKYKQVSCCKIAPITNENYCPNCGKKILK